MLGGKISFISKTGGPPFKLPQNYRSTDCRRVGISRSGEREGRVAFITTGALGRDVKFRVGWGGVEVTKKSERKQGIYNNKGSEI